MAPKKIGMRSAHIEFLTCIALHMVIPLMPLFIEAWKTNWSPSKSTVIISAAMYSISIGLSSKNKAIFAICILICVVFSVIFGSVIGSDISTNNEYPGSTTVAYLTMLFVFVMHALERYNIHVVDCTPYWGAFNQADNG